MAYTNSSLVVYTKLSPHNSGLRNHGIDTVAIHCMAGNLSVETCGAVFSGSTRASSNYGIGSDGRVGMYVPESNRSWCTSSSAVDNRAVTIEVANTDTSEPYPVSDAAYRALIRLLVDICQRNGIPRLIWRSTKSERVNRVGGANMMVHRDYAAKSCPGQWLYDRMGQIAAEVNEILTGEGVTTDDPLADAKTCGPLTMQVCTESSDLHCRSYPGSYGAIIGSYRRGEQLAATQSVNVEGVTWYFVSNGELEGWSSGAYLGIVATPPVSSTEKPTPPEEVDSMDMAAILNSLTPRQAAAIVARAQEYYATLPESEWATVEFEAARADRITDGTRPRALASRQEVAIMIERAISR